MARPGTKAAAAALGLALALSGAAPASAQVYTRVRNGVVEATNMPSTREYRLTYPGKGVLIHSRAYRLRRASSSAYDASIEAASAQHGVSSALVKAVIQVESDFDALAVSSKGAQGLMQLMPGTARRFGVMNAFDPVQNIHGGVRYLRLLLDLFGGDLELALAGYNAGENAVLRHGRIPPYAETQAYVRKVQGLLDGSASVVRPGQAAFFTPNPGMFPVTLPVRGARGNATAPLPSAPVVPRVVQRPAPFYKWTDGQGVLNVTTAPPPEGTPYTTVRPLP